MSREPLSSPFHGPGKLSIIIGPMFSGKTTELQRRIRRELAAKQTVCICHYKDDTRYLSPRDLMRPASPDVARISTHDKIKTTPTFSIKTLAEIGEEWTEYDAVAIDEGQFFPDLHAFCSKVADAGKKVIVSGLDADSNRQPFGQICQLIPHAEEVHKLNAICMKCHIDGASFSQKIASAPPSSSTQSVVDIGGAEKYVALCRACYVDTTRRPFTMETSEI
jgi:thymidine kinase